MKGKGEGSMYPYKWMIVAISAFVLCCCGKMGPQRPSQRKGEAPQADTMTLAMLELNKQLAFAADQELTELAQQMDEPFALYEANTWMAILDKGDIYGPFPSTNEYNLIHMRMYDLKGNLLLDSEGSYRICRHELPACMDMNIRHLHKGAKARLLAPWYQAYGLKGTENIPPYTNLIIDIELK
ncbi:MAG: FKBP-type peptidyl-prolyl cis-trans isomerase [Paludibacteraceae bacterium]|nr:FKBP-type peptidyl-prolyl cis-trans isomerase [Paludibacteraceae bacterium]